MRADAVRGEPASASAADGGGCPACRHAHPRVFYHARGVPSNSNLVRRDHAAATACRRGDVELGCCPRCGLVFNRRFDDAIVEYSSRYVSTQTYSRTFRAYHLALADRLHEHFGLEGTRVVEIGCGAGEFLQLLTERFDLEAVGVDPAAAAGEVPAGDPRLRFVPRVLDEATAASLSADIVICKMTLEHIPDVRRFLELVTRLGRRRRDLGLFLQVPAAERILRLGAFWDVYYEHCNYFTASALEWLLAEHGFAERRTEITYGGQYLSAFGRFAPQLDTPRRPDPAEHERLVERFAETARTALSFWNCTIGERACGGSPIVLWGSGSKATAFLHALSTNPHIAAVVDVNPAKQGQYIAGTGHPIVPPDALAQLRPGCIIAMNPNYVEEIAADISQLGVTPEILSLA
jgi:SAM-dependent methyltransferase